MELLKVFAVTLVALSTLMILVGLAQEALRQGLGPMPVLRLIPYAMPNALVFALPGSILFSTCSVFGRMSAANEIVAIQSVGISPWALTRPALVLGCLLSLVTVCLVDAAFSWGYAGIQRVVLESAEEIAYGVLRRQGSYSKGPLSVQVASVDGHRLIRPTITIRSSASGSVMMTAREAQLHAEPAEGALRVSLTDGTIEMGDKAAVRFPNTIEQSILLTGEPGQARMDANPSHMRLGNISAAISRQREQIDRLQQSAAAEAAYQIMTGDFEALTDMRWSERLSELERGRQRLFRLKTEPFRRWASGFSCLAFVVVGLSLSLRLRNSDVWTTFGLCILPILVVYYPLFAFGLDRAKNGALPPYCVWLGNLVCFGFGFWMLRKAAA
ncbi:MAG: LptF/LptG family permease [Planctomycetes bacterium]|nr:LptF/LptG family permease [Planctomycetota bacterium]